MKGKLKDLAFGREGEQIITLTTKTDCREWFDELKADCKLCRYCPPEYESICRNCFQNETLTKFTKNKEIENDTD